MKLKEPVLALKVAKGPESRTRTKMGAGDGNGVQSRAIYVGPTVEEKDVEKTDGTRL